MIQHPLRQDNLRLHIRSTCYVAQDADSRCDVVIFPRPERFHNHAHHAAAEEEVSLLFVSARDVRERPERIGEDFLLSALQQRREKRQSFRDVLSLWARLSPAEVADAPGRIPMFFLTVI